MLRLSMRQGDAVIDAAARFVIDTGFAAEKVAVWDGHYYALKAMASFGITGAVRAVIALHLTHDDVERLLAATWQIASNA